MSEVKVAHLVVVISGLSEEIHNTLADDAGKWQMRVQEAVVSYEWDRLVGYWRVSQTSVSGKTIGRVPAPSVYTWPRGDAGKPMWVVALEHQHYPTRTMDRKETVL